MGRVLLRYPERRMGIEYIKALWKHLFIDVPVKGISFKRNIQQMVGKDPFLAYELERDRDKDTWACGKIGLFEMTPLKKDSNCPFSIFFSLFNIKN
ncbi:hypothetical protein [Pseudobacillus badius]|uniref:hypothetical protein n=1 Tax=Bacillus badius TaxID=1455 RepID=UPI000F73CDC8|nr:hypothetical protein [Bacillus badius]TDV99576.1 hypothetical protein B0G66_1225 [Bacillus badius]